MKLRVSTYSELSEWVDMFSKPQGKKPIGLLIIVGPPGVSKSTTIRNALTEGVLYLTGSVTAFQLYREAYQHRDRPIVIDDVDNIFTNKDAVRILKNLCETTKTKWVGWHSASALLSEEGIPTRFPTESRLCIISNTWDEKDKNLSALADRAILIEFAPSADEVHAKAKKIYTDPTVLDFFAAHLNLIRNPSLRLYEHCEMLIGHKVKDWVEKMRQAFGIDPETLAYLRLRDQPFKTEEARMKAWCDATGRERPTYYRLKAELGGKRKPARKRKASGK